MRRYPVVTPVEETVVRKTWVVVADRSRARIFSIEKPRGALTEIEDLVHPEARAHDRDLTSDRPGRSSDNHVLGTAHAARDQQAHEFAREIASRLESGRNGAQFERLVLVAGPDVLGFLRKSMSSQVAKLVVREVEKNLTQQRADDIRSLLPEYL
jgi:protein required for attachment to host cells